MSKYTWILVLTNLITLIALIMLSRHFRVPQKAYQRFIVENRAPLLTTSFESNRHYRSCREILSAYNCSATDTMLIGDSLVSDVSWQELLSCQNVAGRGIPGDTSEGVLYRIDDYLNNDSTKCIIIWVGTNDIDQRVDLALTIGNIEGIVQAVRGKRPTIEFAVCETLPVAPWIEHAEDRNQRTKLLNEAVRHIAKQLDVEVISLYSDCENEKGYLQTELTRDGVHLNAQGYRKICSKILPFLEAKN